MSVLASIAEFSLLAFGLLLLAVQLGAHVLGYRLGRRRSEHAQPENVGVVVGGMIALLAFVLALTLSFASARYSERRAGTLAEANAIGTAWLRAEALGGKRGEQIARLLEQYTKVREDFARTGRVRERISELNQQTNALQSTIWGHMAAIIREQPGPVSVSLMTALNDTFDTGMTERFAIESGLPSQIFWLLIILTLVSTVSLGYQLGIKGKAQPVLVLLLCAMWTLVMVNILDLASARLGNFRTDTSPYDWTLRGFKGGVTIPQLPG